MSLSSIDLWQRISAEGIASPMQCRTWAAEAAKSLSAEQAADGLQVLKKLIEIERLSKYQAKVLAGQSNEPLRMGPWHIRRKLKAPLWQNWLELQKIDLTKATSPPAVWARWVSSQDVERLQASAPALTRGIQLANVQAEHLQNVGIPELGRNPQAEVGEEGRQNSDLFLQVAPLEGELLTVALKAKPLFWQTAEKVVRQISVALSALHQQQIFHGRVLPDRIYWDGEEAILAVDPLASLTATLDTAAVGLLGEHLPGLTAAQFLAPEFVAPGQLPTISSDVYALGCTWFWMLTGEAFAQGKDIQSILANHARGGPALPDSVAMPEPFRRVLSHCLSANATARFQDATALLAALKAAEEVVNRGKSKPAAAPSRPKPEEGGQAKPLVRAEAVPTPTSSSSEGQSSQAVDVPQSADERTSPLKATPRSKSKAKATRSSGEELTAQPPEQAVRPASLAESTPAMGRGEPAKSASSKTNEPASEAKAEASSNSSEVSRQKPNSQGAKRDEVKVVDSVAPQSSARSSADTTPTTEIDDSSTESASPAAFQGSETQSVARQAPKPANAAPKDHSKKLASQGTASQGSAMRGSARRKRKKNSNKWMIPVFGSAAFLIFLLLVLKFSGALSTGGQEVAERPKFVPPPEPSRAKVIPKDPLAEFFDLRDSSELLWVPPVPPERLALDLLPPGAGGFISFRPQQLLADAHKRSMVATFDPGLSDRLQAAVQAVGLAASDIAHVLVGFYAPEIDGGDPRVVYRVHLAAPQPLSYLKQQWAEPKAEAFGALSLLVADDKGYLLAGQPLADAMEVTDFCVGPLELMQESAQLGGAPPPLFAPVEALWKVSNEAMDFSLLFSPAFLFAEGRKLIEAQPRRLQEILRRQIGSNIRAVGVKLHFDQRWFAQVELVGPSAQQAGQVLSDLQATLEQVPTRVENWFVQESAHPHWRAVAFRFPLMLRKAVEYTRFGIEDGVAISNLYLPTETAPSLMLASWIALQDGATLAGGLTGNGTPTVEPLGLDEYLSRPINLTFDQEPIEVALQLIGEEANDGLPLGTDSMRFTLNGDAFEAAGITRNQQLSEFVHRQLPMRDALTEVARRGNPSPGAELTSAEQKLIWLVEDDPQQAGKKMISLTTRAYAKANGIELPIEFAEP